MDDNPYFGLCLLKTQYNNMIIVKMFLLNCVTDKVKDVYINNIVI